MTELHHAPGRGSGPGAKPRPPADPEARWAALAAKARDPEAKPPPESAPDAEPPPEPPEEKPPDAERKAEEKPPSPRKKKKGLSPLLRFLIKLGLVGAILAGVFTFVLGLHICRGNAMYPFIMDGDLLVTYKLDPYRVGDAVVYASPLTGETAVSRIVAAGASAVNITDQGELLVNGSIPDERVFYFTRKIEGSEVGFPYYMTGDGFFLLDDYRTVGKDSRLFGEVPEDRLRGKVVYVFRRRGI